MKKKRYVSLLIAVFLIICICSFSVFAASFTCQGGGDQNPATTITLKMEVEYPDGETDPLRTSVTCSGDYQTETGCTDGGAEEWRTTTSSNCQKQWTAFNTICADSGLEGVYDLEFETVEGSCGDDDDKSISVYWDSLQYGEDWCEMDDCGNGDWGSYFCCSPRTMTFNGPSFPSGTSSKSQHYTNEDCKLFTSNTLCYYSKNPKWESVSSDAEWLTAGDNVGEVVYHGCQDEESTTKEDGPEYLALSNSWKICSSSNWEEFVQASVGSGTKRHGFICVTSVSPQEYSIAECNPDSGNSGYDMYDQYSFPGGMVARGGKSINLSDSRVQFCNNHSKWSMDLDAYEAAGKNGKYCDNAYFPPTTYSSSVTGSRMKSQGVSTKWTGSNCCGETDDWENQHPDTSFSVKNEYYNDDDRSGGYDGGNNPGACFNNWHQDNESFLSIYKNDATNTQQTLTDVMVWHGTFQGCAVDHTIAMPSGITCANSRTSDSNKPYGGVSSQLNLANYGFSGDSDNDFLLGLFDEPNSSQPSSGTQLIYDNQYCTVYNWSDGTSYFCSYNETWMSQDISKARTHLSFIPWVNSTLQQAECCQPTECWNGSVCLTSATETFSVTPHKLMNSRGDGFMCKDGDWDWAFKKSSWDGSETGYCLENTQCLVSVGGEYSLTNEYGPLHYPLNEISTVSAPACVNNEEFYLDHYCDNGTWTTRTKYLALEMYNLVKSGRDFTLYCDSYEKVLNKYDYILSGDFSTVEQKYFLSNPSSKCMSFDGASVPCANHVCVLLEDPQGTDPKMYFGTSINYRLNTTTSTYDIAEAMGSSLSSCSNHQSHTDSFTSCGSGGEISFHGKKSIVIFTRETFSGGANYFDALKSLFTNFMQTLLDWMIGQTSFDYNTMETLADQLYHDFGGQGYSVPNFECDLNGGCHNDPDDGDFPTAVCGEWGNPRKVADLSTLYMSKVGGRQIFGMAELEADSTLTSSKFYGIVYEGFSQNICDTFNSGVSGYSCTEQGNRYYVVATPKQTTKEISYESIVDLSTWEQWVFLAPSTRLQN